MDRSIGRKGHGFTDDSDVSLVATAPQTMDSADEPAAIGVGFAASHIAGRREKPSRSSERSA